MRGTKKLDLYMSFLLALALAVIPGCSSDTSQLVDVGPPPAMVTVSVDSATLVVGNIARASAMARDSSGNPITGRAVTWTSLSPNVAKVSSEGVITAVTAGSAVIQANLGGTTGVASLTAVVPPDLASHNFDDGTLGPYTNGAGTDLDIIADPTGANKGKVVRLHYAGTNQDRNRNFEYDYSVHMGKTMYFRGRFYFPIATDFSTVFLQRKLLYWQRHVDYNKYGTLNGGPVFWEFIVLYGEELRWDGGYVQQAGGNLETMSPLLARLSGGRWYTLEHQMTMNSSPSARDGIVRIWLDGVLIYEKLDMGFTDPAWGGQTFGASVLDWNDIYFQYFLTGDQTNYSGTYDEYRYWDNAAFSTSRIGQ